MKAIHERNRALEALAGKKMIVNHSLNIRPSFVTGFDAECECSDPDIEVGWTGVVGIFSASFEDIEDWYHDHLADVKAEGSN